MREKRGDIDERDGDAPWDRGDPVSCIFIFGTLHGPAPMAGCLPHGGLSAGLLADGECLSGMGGGKDRSAGGWRAYRPRGSDRTGGGYPGEGGVSEDPHQNRDHGAGAGLSQNRGDSTAGWRRGGPGTRAGWGKGDHGAAAGCKKGKTGAAADRGAGDRVGGGQPLCGGQEPRPVRPGGVLPLPKDLHGAVRGPAGTGGRVWSRRGLLFPLSGRVIPFPPPLQPDPDRGL